MIDNNYKNKIIESIESNIKVLENGIKDLETNSKSGKKLDLNFKEELLDAANMLEIAVYRSKIYNICILHVELKNKLQTLNMNLNTIASDADAEEFTHILSCKIIALLTFIIDHTTR